jgi:micrococcal nuclease
MFMRYAVRLVISVLVQGWLTVMLPAAAPQEFAGVVVGVADGDTITVLHDGLPERVRLHGIDCPERKQAFYREAKTFTAELAFQKPVNVRIRGRDRWKRTIGEVVLPSRQLLNHELAWWFRRYAVADVKLQALEDEARAAKRGLWVDGNAVAPWVFRKQVVHPTRQFHTPSTKQAFGALSFSNASGTLTN